MSISTTCDCLQVLMQAREADDLRAYHFALLRQVLENVASFLGKGQFGYVLSQIGIEDPNDMADIINTLSHKKVYYYESDRLVDDQTSRCSRLFWTNFKRSINFGLAY